MRTWTTAEERAYDGNEPQIAIKVEIEDDTATLRDWCDLDGACFVESIGWADNLDQPMASGEASIDWHRTEHDGMSPFVTGGRYEGYLAEWREIVISTKVYPPGADASAFAWREVFRGRIDSYDLSALPGKIQFRDKIGAELMDQQIQSVEEYGDDAGAKDVEDVIADILTDHDKTSATLETPVASSYQVKAYNQTKMKVLQAAKNLAFTLGWDIRPKWYESGSDFRLTLYEPDRANTTADYTVAPGFIRAWNEFGSTVENIRNAVRIWYGDAADPDADGNPGRKSVVRTAETSPAHDLSGSAVASSSIDKYGWRLMEIAEASTSVVADAAAATVLADYAIDDLATPTVIARCTLANYFWPVELNDLYDFEADGKRLGADTKAAIHGYAHALSPSGGATTELYFRAKPGLGPSAYAARSGNTILQPDDKAPDAPSVTIRQTPLGVLAEVITTGIRDFDRVMFYVGPRADFEPAAANLVQSSRSTTYAHQPGTGIRREFLKVQIRDLVGNISATSAAFPLAAKKTDHRQLSQTIQAKTQVGFYADHTVSAYSAVVFDKYDAGEFLGDYNAATGRFFARDGGTYRVAGSGKLTTTMTEGTDYILSVRRDPDGDDAEVARATVTGGVFQFEAFVPLDEADEIELQVVDPGSGVIANVTFDSDYTNLKIELSGTQQRTKPYPFVEADPVFLDHGPSGDYSSVAGECHAVFRLSNGEVLFTSGAAGAANPARLHRNEVNTAKARTIDSVSSSTDYWFGEACELADRTIILCVNKEDATVTYSLRGYNPGTLAQSLGGSHLGAGIEPRAVCHADNVVTFNPIYLGTVETAIGKVRSIKSSDLSVIGTSSDLGAGVNSIAHMNPQEDGGGIVVAMLSDATQPDIVALDASDVTAAEVWRIQLDTLAVAGTSDDACQLKTSPDGSVLYAVGGTTNPTVYAISPTGDIIWSEDLGDHSALADITGCLSLDVHPVTGDIAVLCYYADTATELDCVTFDPDGNYRWAWRALGELDPADDPDWTSSTTGHRIAFATDGAIWVSSGGAADAKAKIIKPFSEIPDAPPGIASNALIADFDAEALDLADGAAVTNWTANRNRRSQTLADGLWRLENDTLAEQPTFRGKWRAATVDSVARVRTAFAAVEFDGTERLLGNIESTILADGAVCVLVCEPVDATGDYFSAYEDVGSAAAPLIELENASGRLEFRVNVDGVQDTNWSHASRAGLQAVGCRGAVLAEAGIWLNNAKPNKTAAEAGTDATPDGDPRIRLGQAGSTSGDWFAGWVYRWIWLKPSEFSAGRVASVMHWARQYYDIDELAVEVPEGAGAPADLAGPTQYWSDGNGDIVVMESENLAGGAIIGRYLGNSTNPHYKRIPENLGAATWTQPATNVSSTAARPGGAKVDGDYVYIHFDGLDGVTYGSNGNPGIARLNLSDGTYDWVDTATSSSGGINGAHNTSNGLALASAAGKVYWQNNQSTDELKQSAMSDGSEDSVSGSDSSFATIAAIGVSPDEDYLVCLGFGATCKIARWDIPIVGLANRYADYSAAEIQADGTDTTNDFDYFQRLEGCGTLAQARDGSNKMWFCGGYGGTNTRYVGRYDVTNNTVDLELDVLADSNLTPGANNYVLDIAVDKDGLLYCLCINGTVAVDYDVVRYLADGTFDLSFAAEGVTIMANATYGVATRISVDESYNVYVATTDGYVIGYEQ